MSEQPEWGERRRRREEERRRALAAAGHDPDRHDTATATPPAGTPGSRPLTRRELRALAESGSIPTTGPAGPAPGVPGASGPRPAGATPPVSRRALREAERSTGQQPTTVPAVQPPPAARARVESPGTREPGDVLSPQARAAAVRAQADRAREERERVAREQVERAQRAAQERLAAQRATQERADQQIAAAQRAAAERAARQRAERAQAEELAAEQQRREASRVAQQRAAQERAAAERAAAERAAQEQAARMRAAQEQAARRRAAQEQASRERHDAAAHGTAPLHGGVPAPRRAQDPDVTGPGRAAPGPSGARSATSPAAVRPAPSSAGGTATLPAGEVPRVGEPFAVVSAPGALVEPVPRTDLPTTPTPLVGAEVEVPEPGPRFDGPPAPTWGTLPVEDDDGRGADDEWDDEWDDEEEPNPYSFLQLAVLAVVAFVLGVLIFMVVTERDDDGAEASGAVAQVVAAQDADRAVPDETGA